MSPTIAQACRCRAQGLPAEAEFTDRELQAARLLIESMASDWDHQRYQDTYRQQVEELVEAKRQG